MTPTDEAATFLADDAVCSEDHSTILPSASVVTWLSWSCSPARWDTSVVALGAVSPPALAIWSLRTWISPCSSSMSASASAWTCALISSMYASVCSANVLTSSTASSEVLAVATRSTVPSSMLGVTESRLMS